jgi:hypothetical protein
MRQTGVVSLNWGSPSDYCSPNRGLLSQSETNQMEALHAQINLRGDLVRGVGSRQRRECSGNSPWCSGRCRGRWSGGRPGGCRRGRCRRSGYRHGRRNSWSATGSSSKCEHVHRSWPRSYETSNSHGKKVGAAQPDMEQKFGVSSERRPDRQVTQVFDTVH